MKPFELESRLIDFASRVIAMAEALPKDYCGRYMASQIIRSAISPALNYGEAQAAESRDDFIHKMKICQKELRETHVALKLIAKRNWFPPNKLADLISENNELISIFIASNKTAASKRKINNRKSNRKSEIM